jgi:hypothetical protein
VAAETRVRAAVAAERRLRRMCLGILEEALLLSAAALGRGFSQALDVHPGRRIQRLAALLDCGLVLFVLSEDS